MHEPPAAVEPGAGERVDYVVHHSIFGRCDSARVDELGYVGIDTNGKWKRGGGTEDLADILACRVRSSLV
jgi:hypothetical protein